MPAKGLLIDYYYCTGCHSCETACKVDKGLPLGQYGIKVDEETPFCIEGDRWEWKYIPEPTQLCDLCEERVAAGKDPTCVHHCQAKCMDWGDIQDLAKKMVEMPTRAVLFSIK